MRSKALRLAMALSVGAASGLWEQIERMRRPAWGRFRSIRSWKSVDSVPLKTLRLVMALPVAMGLVASLGAAVRM